MTVIGYVGRTLAAGIGTHTDSRVEPITHRTATRSGIGDAGARAATYPSLHVATHVRTGIRNPYPSRSGITTSLPHITLTMAVGALIIIICTVTVIIVSTVMMVITVSIVMVATTTVTGTVIPGSVPLVTSIRIRVKGIEAVILLILFQQRGYVIEPFSHHPPPLSMHRLIITHHCGYQHQRA